MKFLLLFVFLVPASISVAEQPPKKEWMKGPDPEPLRGDIRQYRDQVLPVPLVDKASKSEAQILFTHGFHNYMVHMKLQPDGSVKGKGYYFRTAFKSDLTEKTYNEFHCEATKQWINHSPHPAIICVGAKINRDADSHYYYPSEFGVGPCATEEDQKAKRLCSLLGTNIELNEMENVSERRERTDHTGHPFVSMYLNQKIDFSRLGQPNLVSKLDRPVVVGSREVLQGGRQVAETQPRDQEDPTTLVLPRFGWESVRKNGGDKIGGDPTVAKILSDYNRTCGWVGLTAARIGKRLFVAFGNGSLRGRYVDVQIPAEIARSTAVAEYLETENQFKYIYASQKEKNSQTFSYKDFICKEMCDRDGADTEAITNPLGCE